MRFRGKYHFKKWIVLENKKVKIIEAANNKSDFPNCLFDYLFVALEINPKIYNQADWFRVILLFYACLSKSPQVELPITSPSDDERYKEDDWSYEGRNWHLYSHMLASAYGWTLEYISQLQVGEALAKIQEILTDKQLEHEFVYGLSEIAYPYNSQIKKNIFKPLDRPHWMKQKIESVVPRFKIAKDMLPIGVINMSDVIPDEYLPKEIIH